MTGQATGRRTLWERIRPVVLGSLAGPVVAWFVAILVYYWPLQSAALRQGEALEFPPGPMLLIGVVGAVVGVVLEFTLGRRPLPRILRGAALGCLTAVAVVVAGTLIVGHFLEGLKGPSPYTDFGRGYLVPISAIAGSLAGAALEMLRSSIARSGSG